MNLKWRYCASLFILVMWIFGCAQADGYSAIRKLIVDKLELEVQVQDTQGKPLAGAVLWYVGSPIRPENGLKLTKIDLNRMAQRYVNQSDFLDTIDMTATVFERANLKGIFYDIGREYTGQNHYDYILVATKRGYLPQVIEGAAPLNHKHLVQFKLQPDSQAHVEPRMEVFDQIMAQARDTSPDQDYMGEARMHKLEQLEQQLRQLAQGLEKDGLNDEASAVYWALADFPSVTHATSADGQQQVIGYANGRVGPAAEADRLKATQLNNSIPKLLISKMMMEQGFPRVGIETESHGLAFLAAFEKMASGSDKEHILSSTYRTAIWQAIKWSTPEKACELLQKAYVFEPATMPPKDWWKRTKDVEFQRKRLGLPSGKCEIQGLQTFNKAK